MANERKAMRRALFNLAAEQGGHFTAAQARELGYSYQAQAHNVAAENWLRIDRGIFRLAEWVIELHDDLSRWDLWSRGRAVVSHETALSVHGIGELESPRVQLTVPTGFTMRHASVGLHFAELPETDIVQRAGFKLTTVTRSIIDIARLSADEDQLARAIQEAQETGSLTLRRLRSRAREIDARAALHIGEAIANFSEL